MKLGLVEKLDRSLLVILKSEQSCEFLLVEIRMSSDFFFVHLIAKYLMIERNN